MVCKWSVNKLLTSWWLTDAVQVVSEMQPKELGQLLKFVTSCRWGGQ